MASYVPDFESDRSSPRGENRNAMDDEDIMELLWQNGQVVTQIQNQRSFKKLTNVGNAEIPFLQPSSNASEISSMDAETLTRQQRHQNQQLFIQEDEMASWLQYPLDDLDREIYPDLLYSQLSAPTTQPPETRSSVMEAPHQISVSPPVQHAQSASLPPTVLPPRVPSQFSLAPTTSIANLPTTGLPPRSKDVEITAPKFQNFLNFSRVPKARIESGQTSLIKKQRETTRMDSNETPTVGQESRFTSAAGSSAQPSGQNVSTSAASTSTSGKDFATTCDLTMTKSPGGSGASISVSVERTPPMHKTILSTAEERKRKEREPECADCHSEGDEFGSGNVKKQCHKSTFVKRSRAAEVHNLSERRRRDRINEKMKALQELVPRCNKVDKASMLDEAIEYLKSLQMQVQMMSMGCGMVPMMHPGAHPYMPPMCMGMGIGMGMGMGMEMGMNQPMMTYPTQFPGSGFPIPPFPLQPVPVPVTARTPTSIQQYPGLNSLSAQAQNKQRMSTPVDPYQHLAAFQQAQVPVQSYIQNQVVVQPTTNNPSNSGDAGNPENHKIG